MMKLILKRLQSETPEFFKKIRKFMVSLGAIGVAIILVHTQYPEYVPEIYATLAGHLTVIGAVGAALTSLATKDQNLSQQ